MQTYSDVQVILVNDGSTDESAAIGRSFVEADTRFTLLDQTNQGQSAARNKGMELISGEYLVFVDADDYLDNDFIEKHLMALGENDYVQSGYRRIDRDDVATKCHVPCHQYQFTVPWGRLYRSSYLATNQLTFPIGMIYEDVIFSLQLWGIKPRVAIIDYCGYNYTYNPHSTTSTFNRAAQRKLNAAIMNARCMWWLKIYTRLRLTVHFFKHKHHETIQNSIQ